MTVRLVTSYAAPYALVTRNGVSPGKRPNTKLAFITEAVAERGQIIGYRGRIATDDSMSDWSRTIRAIDAEEVIATWRNPPSAGAVERERQKLKPVPPEECFPLANDNAIAVIDGRVVRVTLLYVVQRGPFARSFRASAFGQSRTMFFIDPASVIFRWSYAASWSAAETERVNAVLRSHAIAEIGV